MIPVIKTKKSIPWYICLHMPSYFTILCILWQDHFCRDWGLWNRFTVTWFLSPVKSIYNPVCTQNWLPYFTWPRNFEIINSSDAGDRIFQLGQSIPRLLMPWLLKSPEHQQAWYWLCRTDNMYCCSRVNFISLGQANPKIQFKMWIYLL